MSDELLARAAVCPVAGPNRQLPHLALLAADSAFGRPCGFARIFWGACLLLLCEVYKGDLTDGSRSVCVEACSIPSRPFGYEARPGWGKRDQPNLSKQTNTSHIRPGQSIDLTQASGTPFNTEQYRYLYSYFQAGWAMADRPAASHANRAWRGAPHSQACSSKAGTTTRYLCARWPDFVSYEYEYIRGTKAKVRFAPIRDASTAEYSCTF